VLQAGKGGVARVVGIPGLKKTDPENNSDRTIDLLGVHH
jgi:hypothetical protein